MSNKTLHRHLVIHGDHKESLVIEVVDQPGPGNAHHHYDITGFDTSTNPSNGDAEGYVSSFSRLPVIFQHGTVPECGENGITIEALLAICEHRLSGLQSGPYSNNYNAEALAHVCKALDALKQSTLVRLVRPYKGLDKA